MSVSCIPLQLVAVVTGLGLSVATFAQTWNEGPDAGQNGVGAAQITVGSGQLRFINGITANAADVDLFCIRITDEASFSARVLSFGPTGTLNSRLWLFNADGTLQVWNDDIDPLNGDHLSLITSQGVFNNGVYLLGMSFGGGALDASGNLIMATQTSWPGPDFQQLPGNGGVLASWSTSSAEIGGNYTIALTGAEFHVVPEPGVVSLLSVGGLMIARRRR